MSQLENNTIEAEEASPVSEPLQADSAQADETLPSEEQRLNDKPAKPNARGYFTFHDMRLAVGDRLQVQLPEKFGVPRTYIRLLGYFDRVGLIVTAPLHKGVRVPLIDSDIITVRAFTRQSAFAFNCSVARVSRLPYDHLHLSFPHEVRGTIIRKATRVRTDLTVTAAGSEGEPQQAQMQNLSATGALLLSENTLGNKGDTVKLTFSLDIHGCASEVELTARILHLDLDSQPAANGGTQFLHGIEFVDTPPTMLMLIKGYVYQQIIEQPGSLV